MNNVRNGYSALQQRRDTGTKEMSPWLFYPVMLLSSLFIFVTIGMYIRSLGAGRAPTTRHIIKDSLRAELYSWLTHNYEGFTLKTQAMRKQEVYKKDSIREKKIVCYYNVPPAKTDPHYLKPSQIHPGLCTHINIAFATIKNKTINADEHLRRTIKDVTQLKDLNKDLKVLLSVGGSRQDVGFSEMVFDHASRKTFIRSIKSILRTYKLDGIDLDWEFPAMKGAQGIGGRERQHFSQLLHEIRSEYIRERRDYLLTIAAAAPQIIVDVAYDVDQINLYVDYVNVMTYDFHFYTTYTPFTGLNSPLYPRPEDKYYLSTLNINYTTHMYLAKGLDPEKIVIGVPTYGHTFTLVNEDNGGIGSPSIGFGSVGSLGFINYPEICASFLTNISTVITYDKNAKVPYLQRGLEWISYDDRRSVMEKASFIKDHNLGGAMIYSLNADDFSGICLPQGTHIKFPLSQSLKNALRDRSL